MRKWVIQIVAALATLVALFVFYEVLDIDTNIDTGNTVAIGLVEVAFVWLAVAVVGAIASYALRLRRQRR